MNNALGDNVMKLIWRGIDQAAQDNLHPRTDFWLAEDLCSKVFWAIVVDQIENQWHETTK